MKTIILFTLLFISIYCQTGRTVIMCHDDPFKDEQCMKKEKLGSNTFYWVRKCKGAKVCVNLPYYNGIIGACSIKVRPHYDGEACANGNKCGSGICDGTKCKGLNPGVKCQRGLGQCKKGYLCRTSTEMPGYTCQPPIENGEECSSYVESDDTDGDGYILSEHYFYPANNPCKLGYVCSTSDSSSTSKCVKIASQKTTASNPLACETGILDGTSCKTLPSNSSCTTTDTNYLAHKTTSKGAQFCLSNDITTEFENWLNEIGKNKLKDKDANYEAYRYTRNKKKINEAFFRYSHYAWISDADECAYDYLWKQSSSNSLKFSLMILVLALLF